MTRAERFVLSLAVRQPFGLPFRCLVGSGEPLDCRERDAMLSYLEQHNSEWDLVVLHGLPASSRFTDIESTLRLRARTSICRGETLPRERPRYRVLLGHSGVRSRLAFALDRLHARIYQRLSVRRRQFSNAKRRMIDSWSRIWR